MANEVLRLRPSRSIELMVPCLQLNDAGEPVRLNPENKTFWVRRGFGNNNLALIPFATSKLATDEEITAIGGSADDATWLKVVLPGGEQQDDFAMMARAAVLLFVGSHEGSTDTIPAMLPIIIERYATGDEGLYTEGGVKIEQDETVVSS